MPDYLLLMHDIGNGAESPGSWDRYIGRLQATGGFQGGSAIGTGLCLRKDGGIAAISGHLTGFLRVAADDLAAVQALVVGNPVYEAGGTVEIRELPRTD